MNEKLLPFGVTKFEPEIDLSSDVAANVYVSIQSLDEVSVELCAIDGTCVTTDADKGYVAQKNGEWTANEVVDMQIHWKAGALQAGAIATTHVVVSAWYEGQEANKVSFTLVMTNDPALSVQQTMGKSEVFLYKVMFELRFCRPYSPYAFCLYNERCEGNELCFGRSGRNFGIGRTFCRFVCLSG